MCPARGETPTSTTRERMNGRRSSNCVTLVPHTLESEYRLREALPREISPIVSWVLYATLAMTGLKKANPSRTGWSGSNSRSTEFGSLKWIQTQVESRELTVGQPSVNLPILAGSMLRQAHAREMELMHARKREASTAAKAKTAKS